MANRTVVFLECQLDCTRPAWVASNFISLKFSCEVCLLRYYFVMKVLVRGKCQYNEKRIGIMKTGWNGNFTRLFREKNFPILLKKRIIR